MRCPPWQGGSGVGEAGEDGSQRVFLIGPERGFDVPQRVWLPLPHGADAREVQLFYFHVAEHIGGWYPAENVDGWLVPKSYLRLDLDDSRYLGFLVRHAGIVRLRLAAPDGE